MYAQLPRRTCKLPLTLWNMNQLTTHNIGISNQIKKLIILVQSQSLTNLCQTTFPKDDQKNYWKKSWYKYAKAFYDKPQTPTCPSLRISTFVKFLCYGFYLTVATICQNYFPFAIPSMSIGVASSINNK